MDALLTAARQQQIFKQWSAFVFPLVLLAAGLFFLHDYLKDATVTLLAAIAAIASTSKQEATPEQHRFVIAAIMIFTLTWLVPVKTLLYFAAGFAVFHWLECRNIRIHFLGVMALFLASPAFQYASSVFSFPIRLQLAKMVSSLFALAADNIELRGNTIFYNGQEFSVDPACMGIHMLSISMLLGISMLGLLQRKAKRGVSWKLVLFYIVCLFLFNLIANVLRIICLVQFAIPPASVMHDVIGLLCLLLYVCIPASFLAKKLVEKAKPINAVQSYQSASIKNSSWWLLALLVVTGQRVISTDTFAPFNEKYSQKIKGYTSSISAPGILKLENDRSLVYVKFIRGFYDTDHNPSMCWKGSGYEFKNIKKQRLHGREVFTALLQKGNEKLYTAWWYGNHKDVITSQTAWRWEMLKNQKKYAVINITANSESMLWEEAKQLMDGNLLQPLFQ